ncbi:hypothetical protein EI969_10665 [Pseudomonas sp. PB101]|nr:hypothetical protein [Pseudomonas sp. PB101]
MVVNDNAHDPDKRGALESIASKPAPTVSRDCVDNLFFAVITSLPAPCSAGNAHRPVWRTTRW